MPTILACTDGSIYSPNVYQHAAWAAVQMSARAAPRGNTAAKDTSAPKRTLVLIP